MQAPQDEGILRLTIVVDAVKACRFDDRRFVERQIARLSVTGLSYSNLPKAAVFPVLCRAVIPIPNVIGAFIGYAFPLRFNDYRFSGERRNHPLVNRHAADRSELTIQSLFDLEMIVGDPTPRCRIVEFLFANVV